MIIIPAIDILQDKIVRLSGGSSEQFSFYSSTPVEQAKYYDELGFPWIQLVDLQGSKTGNMTILDLIQKIKRETSLFIQVGGGIRNETAATLLFNAGVDKIIIGSLSVTNKPSFERIVELFGSDNTIVSADVRKNKILIKGRTQETETELDEHISYCLELGVDTFICTDVSKEGILKGTNISLYEDLKSSFPGTKFVVSGGVSSINDLVLINKLDPYAVIIGEAIYEDLIDPAELVSFNK